MKFKKISIDGYGRFTDTDLELTPGLHVITGPNERGKSTLRHFIGDMLYGQKRSSTRRIYDENNELRVPWAGGNGYGGRLVYELDSGRVFEVQRSFDSDNEYVSIFDRTDARDVTHEFRMLRNREPAFAEKHLSLTKSVFLGIATISHVSLSDLGDKQALTGIREKILSLTDSGGPDSSAEQAAQWLRDRIAVIGQPAARTKPLPITRQRLMDLQAEYQEVREAAKEIAAGETERAGVLETNERLERRRDVLVEELAHRETFERAELLRKAEALEARINANEEQRAALSNAESFPADRLPEVQRLATLLGTAEKQVQRTEGELSALHREFDEAVARLEAEGVVVMKEADPENESRLAELDSEIGALNERLKTALETVAKAEAGDQETHQALSKIPDFSQFSPDPVRFFSELAGEFNVARHARDDEEGRLERMYDMAREKDDELVDQREFFADREGFLDDLRDYESKLREHEGAFGQFEQETLLLNQHAEDLSTKVPGFFIFSMISLGASGVLGLVAYLTGNAGIFLPAGITAFMFLFFSVSAMMTRRSLRHVRERLSEIRVEEAAIQGELSRERDLIEGLMARTNCDTPRELEALYDRYQRDTANLDALEAQATEQEDLLRTAEERLRVLRDRVSKVFARAGVTIENDDDNDVLPASSRVLTRYQEYRDTKRRNGEFKEAAQRFGTEAASIRDSLKIHNEEDVELSLEVRLFLRNNHYPEEKDFNSALKALRAYRIRSAHNRKSQSEIDVAQGKIKLVRRQLKSEQAELDEHRGNLQRRLSDAGVSTPDDFEGQTKQAQSHKELSRERAALQEQLNTLVSPEDFAELKRTASPDSGTPSGSTEPTAELKRELVAVNEELDAVRKREHALQLSRTERTAGLRSLNEVEEERAATEQRMAELELELQAAVQALKVIEEVTRERHSRIAPRLGELASAYLSEITDGVYTELLVDRDMQISVRIPETKTMDSEPERRLSQGTVDQIYFALRLAMIQSMSEGSESIPMILDDPFANYDDTRLESAMKLLARVGETNQVLLFTCREDVVRIAEAINAPILSI